MTREQQAENLRAAVANLNTEIGRTADMGLHVVIVGSMEFPQEKPTPRPSYRVEITYREKV